VHELSHLYHPYLGDSGRWLAEGLASYYQNVFRARAGMLGADEAWERLDAGFRRGEAATSGSRLDAMGRGRGGTMRVYWAGAAYWLEADLALRRERGTSLDAVLDEYARCCLHGGDSVAPPDFAAALDRIAGGNEFTTLYRRYAASRAFSSLDDAYRRLGITRDGDGLEFTGNHKSRQLREAIMAPHPPSIAKP
jgi:predicted metalloprotease with PDZ domain